MRRIGFIIFCVWAATNTLFAQEFNCTVKINADQVEGTYKQMFTTLENELSELINTRKWSDAKFTNVEKIDCTLQLTIKSIPSQDRYGAELTVQARRPVYQAAYTTSTLNFRDTEVEFSYVENTPLIYNEHTVEDNLIGIVTYYLYMILGVDFDSFSMLGGTPYFQRAENIVTLCQGMNEKGWKAFESSTNRHALVSSFLEDRMKGYREMQYHYHREGLDAMSQNVEKGRSAVTKAIAVLPSLYEANSMSVLLSLFVDTKLDELINIYSKAPQSEKDEIYKMLIDIYPAHSQRLDEIKKAAK